MTMKKATNLNVDVYSVGTDMCVIMCRQDKCRSPTNRQVSHHTPQNMQAHHWSYDIHE